MKLNIIYIIYIIYIICIIYYSKYSIRMIVQQHLYSTTHSLHLGHLPRTLLDRSVSGCLGRLA